MSSTVWVGERRLGKRTDEVVQMKAARGTSTVGVGKMHVDERMGGGVMGMISAVQVRTAIWVGEM